MNVPQGREHFPSFDRCAVEAHLPQGSPSTGVSGLQLPGQAMGKGGVTPTDQQVTPPEQRRQWFHTPSSFRAGLPVSLGPASRLQISSCAPSPSHRVLEGNSCPWPAFLAAVVKLPATNMILFMRVDLATKHELARRTLGLSPQDVAPSRLWLAEE